MTPDNGVGMRLKEKFTLDMRKDISLCSQSVFSKLSQRPKNTMDTEMRSTSN